MATLTKKQKKNRNRILIAAALLILIKILPLTGWVQGVCCLVPYLIIGYDVLRKAFMGIANGQVFDENFLMAIATSIDALSVGFTISEYGWLMALTAAIIIAVVTFILCMAGLRIGKKFGTQLSGKANILGGVILIGIGLEIFITGVF